MSTTKARSTVYEASTESGHKVLYAVLDDGRVFIELPLNRFVALSSGIPVCLAGRSKRAKNKLLWCWNTARVSAREDIIRAIGRPDAIEKLDGVVADMLAAHRKETADV